MTTQRSGARVAVSSLPENGRVVVVEPDEAERRALAEAAGAEAVERLRAELRVRPGRSGMVHVEGTIEADVVQRCVVSLDPVPTRVEERVDMVLHPADGRDAPTDELGPKDVYSGNTVDLGPIVAEHLTLGLDPYPRAPGVAFQDEAPDDGGKRSPFAALAKLKGHDS